MHRSIPRLAAALALPLALSSCLDTGVDSFDLVANSCNFSFAFDTTKMTKTSTGLFVRDLTPGTGVVVENGDEVATYYRGWLTNGTEFDAATPQTSDPLVFPLGAPGIIAGFQQGVSGMKVGGCRQVVIPPALGYGSSPVTNPNTGAVVIPANSFLVFEISLVGQR